MTHMALWLLLALQAQHDGAVRPDAAPVGSSVERDEVATSSDADSSPAQLAAELARLQALLEQKALEYGKGPKRKFISASSKDPAYVAYLAEWVKRIEATGNSAEFSERLGKLGGGKLIVTVVINRFGELVEVIINVPSSVPELNRVVVDIVRLASPFAPLPSTPESIDELHITRTWQFSPASAVTKTQPTPPQPSIKNGQ